MHLHGREAAGKGIVAAKSANNPRLDPRRVHPMEARIAEEVPDGSGWQYEPKWDGFRCLVFRSGDRAELYGKSGKTLTIYFPEIVEALKRVKAKTFVADGELVVPVGGRLSFDALQARLHPAKSRQQRLARETPALLILFDLLADETASLMNEALPIRRAGLEILLKSAAPDSRLRLSPFTRTRREAMKWLAEAGKGALDGIIAKRIDQAYMSGERAMLKIKHLKTADCVVGGFRYGTGSRLVGSLLLGLFDELGKLDHVGFTSGISDEDRPALTRKLEKLKGGEGFSGGKPGGPSRWSTERSGEWVPVKNKLVAEVRYDHVTGGRFRHGTRFLRWRPDKPVRSCTFDQLARETEASGLAAELIPRD